MPLRLSPAELAIIADMVKHHHTALAVQWYGPDSVSPDALQDMLDGGYLTAEELDAAGATGELGDAYAFGALVARVPTAALEEAPAIPPESALSDWERRAALAARVHGASEVLGLGNKLADDFTTLSISSDNEQALAYRRAIAETVATHIEQGKTWSQARGAIGEALGEDWARDLGRIASTETQRAINTGYANALEADMGPDVLVAVIPQPDACPSCRSDYLDNGKPRIFKLRDLPPSTVNFKKKAADQVACQPPRHPWCCAPGAPVTTARGRIPVEDVRLGDLVVTHTGTWRRVVQLHHRMHAGPMMRIRVNGEQLEITPNHAVMTSTGWLESGEASQGLHVICELSDPTPGHAEGERVRAPEDADVLGCGSVDAASTFDYDGPVYNLGVEVDHSYVAAGIVVKNCHCQLTYVEPGWAFDDNWDLMPPGVPSPAEVPA